MRINVILYPCLIFISSFIFRKAKQDTNHGELLRQPLQDHHHVVQPDLRSGRTGPHGVRHLRPARGQGLLELPGGQLHQHSGLHHHPRSHHLRGRLLRMLWSHQGEQVYDVHLRLPSVRHPHCPGNRITRRGARFEMITNDL